MLSGERRRYKVKDIAIFDDPKRLRAFMSKLSWRILQILSEKEMYPMEIARRIKVHEQKVYYHIRKLAKAGAIAVVREEKKKGATAKYYTTSFPAFGVELPSGPQKTISVPILGPGMRRFLDGFLTEEGVFDGKIIVGSPDPHGPFKARARDGHYASYLALFLGQFVPLPEEFAVKLDVDVKAEKEEKNNLILVGGPGTNLITQEVNEFLPIRFNMMPSEHGFLLGGLVSEETGITYTADTIGVISKITNPWNPERSIIVLAGNKAVGTKATVLALTKFWRQTLKDYIGIGKFGVVIQGFDLDGDGKVDSVEVLE